MPKLLVHYGRHGYMNTAVITNDDVLDDQRWQLVAYKLRITLLWCIRWLLKRGHHEGN